MEEVRKKTVGEEEDLDIEECIQELLEKIRCLQQKKARLGLRISELEILLKEQGTPDFGKARNRRNLLEKQLKNPEIQESVRENMMQQISSLDRLLGREQTVNQAFKRLKRLRGEIGSIDRTLWDLRWKMDMAELIEKLEREKQSQAVHGSGKQTFSEGLE